MPPITTVVGVPGRWATRDEVARALGDRGLILAGGSVREASSRESLTLEIHDHDDELRQSYEAAGGGALDAPTLDAIDLHGLNVYVVGEGGSLAAARRILRFVATIVEAGGLGVKVESAGVAHSPALWKEIARHSGDLSALYTAFAVRIAMPTGAMSCGMHNLGLPDAFVEAPAVEAGAVIDSFLLAVLANAGSNVAVGARFSRLPGEPSYGVTHGPCESYPPDDLFFNPFGVYRLSGIP